ncbi:MAG: hypothetical protein IPH69_11440 [Bacteroidales bacterium]|nr:hypothetical protein [Bacteroidales bacterium]MBK7628489.1 hypothetical protein [Bacteroidales bacterium]
MRKISVYIISLLFLMAGSNVYLNAQDTLDIPLKMRAGIDIFGPAMYFADKNILSAEGYFSIDLNEKRSAFLSAGYLDYKYSQPDYEYINKGIFLRTGIDFNLLKPEKAMGKYYTGIGLHYGINRFTSEVPLMRQENYWGTIYSSVSPKTSWGHFIEVSPGVRAEIFKNFSMGWNISLRMLVYSGTGKDLRSIYLPGFGNGATKFSTGVSYFISWNIPYKKIRVIIKKEEPEETEETDEIESTSTYGGGQIRQ